MSLKQLLLCVVAAFVMMPESGALHVEQKQGETLGVSEPETDFQKRNIEFSAKSVDAKALKSVNTPFSVRIALANGGSKPLTFVNWGSPFEEKFSNEIVRTEPKTSSYLGPIVNRQPGFFPESALTTVEPGTELAVIVDLNEHLAFHEKGNYKVRVAFPLVMVDTEASRREKLTAENSTVQTMATEINVEVEAARSKKEVQEYFEKHFIPHNCSTLQFNTVHTAFENGYQMVQGAVHRIETQQDPSNFRSWLGDNRDCPIWDRRVLDGFRLMADGIFRHYHETHGVTWVPEGVIFDCTCPAFSNEEYTNAYVYPYRTETKVIYVCRNWWRRPSWKNMGSQAGIMVHEASHFRDLIGTTDHGYGTTHNQNLARSDPCKARENADNWESYSENISCPGHPSC